MLRSWTTTAVLPSAVVTDAAETIGASCLCLIKAKCLSKRDQVNYSAPGTLVEFVASGLTPTLWMTGSAGPTKAQTLANVSNSGCCGNAQHGLVTTGWIGLANLPDSAIPNIDWSYLGGEYSIWRWCCNTGNKDIHRCPHPAINDEKSCHPSLAKRSFSFVISPHPHQVCRYPCGLRNRNFCQADWRKAPTQTLKVS